MLNTCFPFGSPDFGCVLGRGCLCDQPPIKAMGPESLACLLSQQHVTHAVVILAGRIVSYCALALGKKLQKAVPGFPKIMPHVPFPFIDFALYPFNIITSIEY